ncbi:hypothetical protein [Winogradskyella sp. 4-2091]|uniref:hypothetical protein n=1 Tax=Winogradskyella sp. 4-2091 TaxID=3381659 RepID=UPI003892C6B9
MKSYSHILTILFFTLITFGCAPEENTSYTPEDTNEFSYNGNNYPLMSAIIVDSNSSASESGKISINIFNKSSSKITSNSDLTDVSYVNFEVDDINLQNTTYNSIDAFSVSINGSITGSEFNPGTQLLSDSDPDSDLYAQSGFVTITNYTAYNIVFNFSFTRNDGTIITGSYDGNYLITGN